MKTKSAKEILIEESESDPNFALLTGTMPVIERAMERHAYEVADDLFGKFLRHEHIKNSEDIQLMRFTATKIFNERFKTETK